MMSLWINKLQLKIHNKIEEIINIIDPKFFGIYKIIKKYRNNYSEHDKIYIKRLRVNPASLNIHYWKNHQDLLHVQKYLSSCDKILDFGCGSGQLDIILARNGKNIHGIDISPLGIEIANYLRDFEDDAIKKRLKFSVVDITHDISQNKYGCVWSNHVFEHIINPEPILNGLRNWVDLNAIMLITMPLGTAFDDPDHVHHFFTKQDIIDHFSDIIEIKTIEIDNINKEIHVFSEFSKIY